MITITAEQAVLPILAFSLILMSVAVIIQERRLRKLLRGKSAKDLEDSFNSIEKEYQEMKKFRATINAYLETVEKRLGKETARVAAKVLPLHLFPKKATVWYFPVYRFETD